MNIVYLLTDTITDKKYIGSKKDWKGTGTYFGTLRCKEKHPKYNIQQEWKKASVERPETFVMKILETFDSYGQHVIDSEYKWQLKYDVVKSKEFVNGGFSSKRMSYPGLNKGMTIHIDSHGNVNTIKSSEFDPNIHIHPNKGKRRTLPAAENKLVVKDDKGNTLKVDIKDPRYISGELKHIHQDTIIVYDKITNEKIRILKENFNQTIHYIKEKRKYVKKKKKGSTFFNLELDKHEVVSKDNYNPKIHLPKQKDTFNALNKLTGEIEKVHKKTFNHKTHETLYKNEFIVYNSITKSNQKIHKDEYDESIHTSIHKNKVMVKDSSGKVFKTNYTDPRISSGELTTTSPTEGKSLLHKRTQLKINGEIQTVEYWISHFNVKNNKGLLSYFNKNNITFTRISKDEVYKTKQKEKRKNLLGNKKRAPKSNTYLKIENEIKLVSDWLVHFKLKTSIKLVEHLNYKNINFQSVSKKCI